MGLPHIWPTLTIPPSLDINTLKTMRVSLSQLRAGLWSIVVFTMVSRPCSVGSVSGSALYCVIYTRAYSFEAPHCLLTWSVHNIQYLSDAVCSHHSIYHVNHKATRKQWGATGSMSLTKDLACNFLFVLCSLFLPECQYSVSRQICIFLRSLSTFWHRLCGKLI